jgi:two-component system response regulator AtoC
MKKQVLMVDDDEEICEEMAEILEGEGYVVRLAFNGLEAKKMIEQTDLSVILLDLKMPGLNGFEVLKIIREKRKTARVLILSGRFANEKYLQDEDDPVDPEKREMIKCADGFINKPFDIDQVLARIRHFCDPSPDRDCVKAPA